MAIKNILLIGGLGEIGLKIIENLKKKFNLYVFDNKNLKNFNIKGVKFIKGNCLELKDLKKLPKNLDATIFLIGKKGGPESLKIKNYKNYFKYNCETLIKFLDIEKINFQKKIIFFSTEHVYGDNTVIKNNNFNEQFPKNFYGSTKLFSEKILYSYWKKNKISIDIFRVPRIVVEKKKNLISDILYKIKKNRNIIINTQVKFHFVYIDDLIAAIEKSLLQLKKNYRILNIYNNSGGYSIKEIALLINKKIMNNTKLNFKINKVKKEHNPKNLKISNFSTKTSLKWHPKFDMNNLMNKLIKKDEIKKSS